MHRIVIFANGDLPDLHKARNLLRADDFIICADGGTRHAIALGVTPNLVIGDMDSTSSEHWRQLEKAGVALEVFPRDKNETDLELAIQRAVTLEPRQIIIVAALGGRLDQTIGNIALLTAAHFSQLDIRLDDGAEETFVCWHQAQIHGRSGDIVSLLPWGSSVTGIQTTGLKWALKSETLYPEKTRGISNELLDDAAEIQIASGTLIVIHTRTS